MTTAERLNVLSPVAILENVAMAKARLSEVGEKRVRAGRMLLAGKGCAEMAGAVGLARQTVYTWKRLLDEAGFDALRSARRGRPAPPAGSRLLFGDVMNCENLNR